MRLKNLFPAFFSASFLFLSSTILYSRQVIITQIQGQEVEILKQGKSKWNVASGGQTLQVGDKVRTGKKGRVTLLSQEGHKILIKQETVFQISKLGPVEWEFMEESGRVRVKAKKLEADQSLKVKTPTAVCSVRGTEFEVFVDMRGITLLDVYDGNVGFSDPRKSGPPVNVPQDSRSTMGEGGRPEPPKPIPPNERTFEPGFSDSSRGQAPPGTYAGGMPPQMGPGGPPFRMGGPGDEKLDKEMKSLQDRLNKLDPKDTEGRNNIMKERETLIQNYFKENKDEIMARMKENFNQEMKDFKGSDEEKARKEARFKEDFSRMEKEGFKPGQMAYMMGGGSFGSPGGMPYGRPPGEYAGGMPPQMGTGGPLFKLSGPTDEKFDKQMKTLDEQLRKLDPKDMDARDKIVRERETLMQNYFKENKDEITARMKENFNQAMKDFKGTDEEKARMEAKFNKDFERMEKEGFKTGQIAHSAGGGSFGPPGGGPYGPPPGMEGEHHFEPPPNKDEVLSDMKENYDQFMKNYNGPNKEEIAKTFREEINRVENTDFNQFGYGSGPGEGSYGQPPGGPTGPTPPGGWREGHDAGGYDNKEGRDRRELEGKHFDEWVGGDRNFKDQVYDEVRDNLERDYIQDTIKDEIFIDLAQTSKSLIDIHGNRVRLEENVVYTPPSNTFKFVSLSHRSDIGRSDSITFEVVANQTLPDKLEDAGNLWFSAGPDKPRWYVTKQRLSITNGKNEDSGTDRIVQLFLDGDSKEVLSSNFFFDPNGQYVSYNRGFQTIFDHRYEFINGDKRATDNIWNNVTDRPRDLVGMMWHMRPLLKETYDERTGVTSSFWDYAFVTTSGSGSTAIGKMSVTQFQPGSGSTIAHFIQTKNYINFVDTNGNGRLDKGETFEDFNRNGTRDQGEPFQDEASMGLNGASGDRKYNSTRDGTSEVPPFFSDLDRDGQRNRGEASVAAYDPFDLLTKTRPWAFLKENMLLIDDSGNIQDFTKLGFGKDQLDNDPQALAKFLEHLNMERIFTSSEFVNQDGSERNIDAITTPRTFMRAKLLEFKTEGNQDPFSRR